MSEKNNLNNGQNLFDQSKRLKSSFDIVLVLFENRNDEYAVLLALNAIKKIHLIANQEDTGLVKNFLNKNYPQIGQDKKTLEQWATDFSKNINFESRAALLDSLNNIKAFLTALTREVKTHYKIVPSWLVPFQKIPKKTLAVFLIGLGCLVLIYSGIKFSQRNQGLTGEYFKGIGLEKLVKTRRDRKIDFDWKKNAPMKGLNKDKFSIRWTGQIKIPRTGDYNFYTYSDDGVRLWVADKKIIDNWTNHKVTLDKSTLYLKKGLHNIKLEYYENKKWARIRLLWKGERDLTKTVIPPKFLIQPK